MPQGMQDDAVSGKKFIKFLIVFDRKDDDLRARPIIFVD
jgi:hypothetical protein